MSEEEIDCVTYRALCESPGKLTPDIMLALERHTDTCSDCSAWLDQDDKMRKFITDYIKTKGIKVFSSLGECVDALLDEIPKKETLH